MCPTLSTPTAVHSGALAPLPRLPGRIAHRAVPWGQQGTLCPGHCAGMRVSLHAAPGKQAGVG